MINQLMKLGLFVAAGLWLKHRGRGLLLLVGVLVLTWILHGEYLAYAEQADDNAWLELSYILKWAVFLVACGSYYWLVERKIRRNPDASRNTISHPEDVESQGDGFDFLRHKKTLDSESDKLLK